MNEKINPNSNKLKIFQKRQDLSPFFSPFRKSAGGKELIHFLDGKPFLKACKKHFLAKTYYAVMDNISCLKR